MDLKLELEKSPILLISMTSENYNQNMVDILKQLSGKSIHYVTLNKTYQAVQDSIKRNSIVPKAICFIDGITNTALSSSAKPTKACSFLKSPNSLKELEQHLINDPHGHEVVVFDSLSTSLIYEKVDPLARFVVSLIGKMKPKKIVFIILNGDKETKLIEKIKGSVKVINLK